MICVGYVLDTSDLCVPFDGFEYNSLEGTTVQMCDGDDEEGCNKYVMLMFMLLLLKCSMFTRLRYDMSFADCCYGAYMSCRDVERC